MRLWFRIPAAFPGTTMLSQTAEYALRVVLFIAQREAAGPVVAETIATALGLPQNYIAKTLHRLAQAGVLASVRGKGGGFRLAVPAGRLPLIEVVGLFDRVEPVRQCLLGRPACSDAHPCEAHGRWKGVSETVAHFFRDTTIGDLLGEAGVAVPRARRARGR